MIKNGVIIDGTGRDGFRGDVIVADDRIESVIVSDTPRGRDIAAGETGRVIDAEGRIVAPGFIDCHSHFDIYPHFCGNSYLGVFLPAWFVDNLAANLKSAGAIRRLRIELGLAKFLVGFKLSDIQIMQAGYPDGEKYNGMNIVEIARQESIDPVAAMLNIIAESEGKALQLTYGYSGDNAHEQLVEKLMAHEGCLFETDTLLKSSGFANPASYGAFPRILGRFVRNKGVLSLAEAVSKMTGQTARWMGIA